MAIARASHLIGAISGNLGAVTFAQSRQGLLVKHRPLKTKTSTETRQSNQALFRHAQHLWTELTITQRVEWIIFAISRRQTNRLGVHSSPTPYNVFMSFNITHLFLGGLGFPSPPQWTPPTETWRPVLTFTQGGPYTVHASDDALPYGTSVLVYGSRTMRNYLCHTTKTWTYIGRRQVNEFDIQSQWDPILGPPITGEILSVRLYSTHFLTFKTLQSQMLTQVLAP